MDTAAIVTIVSHMQNRMFYDILKAMFHNHFIELQANRWTVEIDSEKLGRVVMSHQLAVDDVLGRAYETWAWTQHGQARVLHIVGSREGSLSVVLDGNELATPKLTLHTRTDEATERIYLVVSVQAADHESVFEGLLE